MKSIWIAYLFSLHCTASLTEFFEVQRRVNEGMSVLDPQLEEVSMAWRELCKTHSSFIDPEAYKQFRKNIALAMKAGIKFTYPGCADFPQEFLTLNEIPFFLSYLGNPIWKKMVGIAVVGSREPSADSEAWCEKELSELLTKLPIYTVSGGARGIDQICHRVTVRLGLPTVALLPSGVRNIYPPSLPFLVRALLDSGGAIMSEYLPDTEMRKDFFQRRNRLIAGLSRVCLIVEARERSGTLITARQALEQSKPLLILPSHPYDLRAVGGLNLLLEGATPVRDAQDLITFMSSELRGLTNESGDLVLQDQSDHYL